MRVRRYVGAVWPLCECCVGAVWVLLYREKTKKCCITLINSMDGWEAMKGTVEGNARGVKMIDVNAKKVEQAG